MAYPKIKNFIWKVIEDGIATNAELFKRKIVVPLNCTMCNHTIEDLHHLNFGCPITTEIIRMIKAPLVVKPQCLKILNVNVTDGLSLHRKEVDLII